MMDDADRGHHWRGKQQNRSSKVIGLNGIDLSMNGLDLSMNGLDLMYNGLAVALGLMD